MFLEAQFGDAVSPLKPPPGEDSEMTDSVVKYEGSFRPGVEIKIDNIVARVYFETLEVEGGNESLRMRVKSVVERAVETVAPFVDLVGVY